MGELAFSPYRKLVQRKAGVGCFLGDMGVSENVVYRILFKPGQRASECFVKLSVELCEAPSSPRELFPLLMLRPHQEFFLSKQVSQRDGLVWIL